MVIEDFGRRITFLKLPTADECFDYKFKTKYYINFSLKKRKDRNYFLPLTLRTITIAKTMTTINTAIERYICVEAGTSCLSIFKE